MDEDIDRELERLRDATASVGPRAGFSARVMSAVASEPAGFWFDFSRVARVLVPIAALAAAAGVVWGIASSDAVDTAIADTDDDGVEIAW